MKRLYTYGTRAGYDILDAVQFINENVEPKPIGYCAKFVRKAMEAGGMNTSGRPGSAKD